MPKYILKRVLQSILILLVVGLIIYGLLRCLPESVQNTQSKRLVPISGSPVDLMMLPQGCAFSARCESCMKLCLNRRPDLIEVGEGHYSRCWLAALQNAEQGVKA